MTEFNSRPDIPGTSDASAKPRTGEVARTVYQMLASKKLALFLLIAILVSCVAGVTLMNQERAQKLIFTSLWFNGLLLFLVVNVAFCFFGRIWGRKLTLISFGMILFHLSFVAMLFGIMYNSMYYFRGNIRLTEGEVLPSGEPKSYDSVAHGSAFKFAWLKGETELVKMHTGYKIDGLDKRAAYEIAVGDPWTKKQGVVYTTKPLDHQGFGYYNDREGYSILVILFDGNGRELYGLHVPLQSHKQKDDSYLYTTGTGVAPGAVPFPNTPEKPLFRLQVVYQPDKLKERTGDVQFKLLPLEEEETDAEDIERLHEGSDRAEGHNSMTHSGLDSSHNEEPIAEGKTPIGEKVRLGEYSLLPAEVRYWVAMNVQFEPGKPIVMTSLCIGLLGMIITFIGRMAKKS